MAEDNTTAPGAQPDAHRFTLSSYDPVEITIPQMQVQDAHINEQLFHIAKGYATFEKVEDREVRPDDCLFIAVEST